MGQKVMGVGRAERLLYPGGQEMTLELKSEGL